VQVLDGPAQRKLEAQMVMRNFSGFFVIKQLIEATMSPQSAPYS